MATMALMGPKPASNQNGLFPQGSMKLTTKFQQVSKSRMCGALPLPSHTRAYTHTP